MYRLSVVHMPTEIRSVIVPAVSVVLELALVDLHRQIACLEVQRYHLASSIPEDLQHLDIYKFDLFT